jgi:hypothetical protein
MYGCMLHGCRLRVDGCTALHGSARRCAARHGAARHVQRHGTARRCTAYCTSTDRQQQRSPLRTRLDAPRWCPLSHSRRTCGCARVAGCATLGTMPLFRFIIFSIRAWSTIDWRRLRKERLFGDIGVIGMLPSLEATSREFSSACMSSHSMSSIVSRYLTAGAVLVPSTVLVRGTAAGSKATSTHDY